MIDFDSCDCELIFRTLVRKNSQRARKRELFALMSKT